MSCIKDHNPICKQKIISLVFSIKSNLTWSRQRKSKPCFFMKNRGYFCLNTNNRRWESNMFNKSVWEEWYEKHTVSSLVGIWLQSLVYWLDRRRKPTKEKYILTIHETHKKRSTFSSFTALTKRKIQCTFLHIYVMNRTELHISHFNEILYITFSRK